jgi:hypothetical protein
MWWRGLRERSTSIILMGKSERKRLFGKFRRGNDNIEMERKETEWEDMDWIHLAQKDIADGLLRKR